VGVLGSVVAIWPPHNPTSPMLPQQHAVMKNNKKNVFPKFFPESFLSPSSSQNHSFPKVQSKIIPLKNKFLITIYAMEVAYCLDVVWVRFCVPRKIFSLDRYSALGVQYSSH
jgi:hypothetical protein